MKKLTRELLKETKEEIEEHKVQQVKQTIKKRIYQIDETKKLIKDREEELAEQEEDLEKLLQMKVEDVYQDIQSGPLRARPGNPRKDCVAGCRRKMCGRRL